MRQIGGHHPHLGGEVTDPLARDLVASRPSGDPWCPTSTTSACLRALLRAARPGRGRGSRVRLVARDVLAHHQAQLHVRHLVEELAPRPRATCRRRRAPARPVEVEDVRDLVRVEVRVDAREEEARALRRPTRLEVLDAVLHEHRDVVAEAQARVLEALREPIRPVVQLARTVTASPVAAIT